MDNFFFDMAVSVVLSTLKASFKDAGKREAVKKAMLKIRNQINALYYDDPDFE